MNYDLDDYAYVDFRKVALVRLGGCALALFFAAMLFFTTGTVSKPGEGFVYGGVYLNEGGKGLAGEKVKVYKNSKLYKTETTDRDGKYKLVLPTGTYTVSLRDKKYGIDYNQKVIVESMDEKYGQDIIGRKPSQNNSATLVKNNTHAEKPTPGTVSGYVYKSQNGNGLMGEKIKIYKGSDLYLTATTEKSGKYCVYVPKGTYAIMLKDKKNGIDFCQAVTVKSRKTVKCRDIIGAR